MCRPCALSRVWSQVSCILHVKVACNVIQWNRFYTDCLETGVLVDPALPDNSDLRRVMDSGSIKKIERGQALPKITTPPGESDCPWLTRPGQLDHSVCPGKDHLILVLSCTNKSLTSKPSDLIQQEGEGELAPREGVKNALHEHLTVADSGVEPHESQCNAGVGTTEYSVLEDFAWVLGSHRMRMFALPLLWWMLSGFRVFKSEESVNSLFNFPRQEISQKLT